MNNLYHIYQSYFSSSYLMAYIKSLYYVKGGVGMSFTIKPPEIDDPELVKGYPVHAKIEASTGSLIYLTEQDFNDLYASIQEYVTTTFCKDCVHGRVSNSGLSYGLSCNLECLQEFHVPESITDYGYNHCHHAYDTCKHATTSKEEELWINVRAMCTSPVVAAIFHENSTESENKVSLDIHKGDIFTIIRTDFADTGLVYLREDYLDCYEPSGLYVEKSSTICYVDIATFYDHFDTILPNLK